MLSRLSFVLALFLALLQAAFTQAALADASFEPGACWFEIPRDRQATCGWLEAPENRAKAENGAKVRLPVVIIEPDLERYAPVVFLTGGPGQPIYIATDEDMDWWFDYYDEQDWLRGRRLVLFDQRGSGMAEPLLDCPEMKDPYVWGGVSAYPGGGYDPGGGLSPPQICARFFTDQGIEIAAYNSSESAADVEDLRQGLAIERWVLFGVSYGTRLAMTVLRDYPANIEAAVLDSVLPPEVDYIGDSAKAMNAALLLLDQACARDAACDEAFGELLPKIKETVTRFDAAPLPLRLSDLNEAPAFVSFDGSAYLSTLFSALYDWQQIERLPLLIDATARQDYRYLAEWANPQYLGEDDLAYGVFLSIGCAEELPFLSDDKLAGEARRFPYLANWLEGDFFIWNCPDWPVPAAAAIANQPVASDVPVLLLSGEYDPVTPSAWAAAALTHLPRGHHVVFKGLGHDVVDSSYCGSAVVADFLANPLAEPKSDCLSEQEPPYFVIDPRDW